MTRVAAAHVGPQRDSGGHGCYGERYLERQDDATILTQTGESVKGGLGIQGLCRGATAPSVEVFDKSRHTKVVTANWAARGEFSHTP